MKHKHPGRQLLLASAIASAFPVWAAPQGGQVSAGQGAIARNGTTTTIQQGSARLAINWQSFGIAANETVQFVQPSAQAVALNRVTGTEASQILGRLEANGQVFLLNPNGVLFGRTAQVSVGGLLASTLDMSDADFLAGRHVLRGSGGVVRNEGGIRAADGGYVALVGGEVHNTGTLVADRGTVGLAAGRQVTLDFAGDGLLKLAVDEGVLRALVRNGGVVRADGGTAVLTARAADALAATVVNNTGLVQARTLENRGGVIRLLGGFNGGTVEVGGRLDASAPAGGDAGFIDTSGAHVRIAPGAQVALGARSGRAGHWLIDPTDINIDAAAASTIAATLDTGANVTQTTAGAGTDPGDITVSSPISWTGTGMLSLEADRNITLYEAISAPNGALLLQAGNAIHAPAAVDVGTFYLTSGTWQQVTPDLPAFAARDFQLLGGAFVRAIGGEGDAGNPFRIADVYGLQGMGSGPFMLSQHYALAGNIDASSAATWNSGMGFAPIGNPFDAFTGSLDGGGFAVLNLPIQRAGSDSVGLFGGIGAGGSVSNLGVAGGSLQGFFGVGALAGSNAGTLVNVWSDSDVSGSFSVGGLVGTNLAGGTITDAHSNSTVVGSSDATGGFVGRNEGTISRAWATGPVSGHSSTGGFAGSNVGTISLAYATGPVDATNGAAGGFVGFNDGAISDAYATGAVTARLAVFDGIGAQGVGGFFGVQDFAGTITRSYSTGFVTNDSVIAGAFGGSAPFGTVTQSYFDRQTAGRTRGIGRNNMGATGLTTAQAKTAAPYAGFDFGNDWALYAGQTYPLLRTFLRPLTITANDAGKVYDGANFAGGNGVGYSVAPDANLLGAATFGGSSQGARHVGTYGIDVGGFHSTQQGYLITYAPGTLTVTPKALTVTGVTANDKVYDAATAATLNTGAATLSGVVGTDSVFLDAAALSGDFGDKNVGNGKAVRVAGAAITGGDAGNYTVDNPAGLTASITPAPLAVIADNQAKLAGAADPALTYGATGFVGPDTAATALAGALDRAAGETAGAYAITQGTLAALQGNYAIAYTAGLLTITAPAPPPAPSVSPAPPAPEPARADLARPPYPQPEVLRPPTCVGSGESDAANCVRTLQLQVVDGGVRLPPRP